MHTGKEKLVKKNQKIWVESQGKTLVSESEEKHKMKTSGKYCRISLYSWVRPLGLHQQLSVIPWKLHLRSQALLAHLYFSALQKTSHYQSNWQPGVREYFETNHKDKSPSARNRAESYWEQTELDSHAEFLSCNSRLFRKGISVVQPQGILFNPQPSLSTHQEIHFSSQFSHFRKSILHHSVSYSFLLSSVPMPPPHTGVITYAQ